MAILLPFATEANFTSTKIKIYLLLLTEKHKKRGDSTYNLIFVA